MRLKDYCSDEMPRERLLDKGAATLSNVELLAILLRSGTGKMNVIDLARHLLSESGGTLRGVASMSVDRIQDMDGIGPGKAACLAAAFELGERLAQERLGAVSMASPKAVYRMMLPLMRRLDHEECWVLFLNRRNMLLSKERMSSGGDDSTVIDSKAIARRAIERKASALILVHNHPSGNALPSLADINMTQSLRRALNTCDIPLLDHVIVCADSYYSFADEELVRNNF